MLISVILPAYNAERTIELAVSSILCQTHDDLELLVADDGSNDKTREILGGIADPRLRVTGDGTNRGRPTRLNEMVAAARGDFIARMDADDVSYPTRLERELELLQGKELDLVGSSAVVIDDHLDAIGRRMVPENHAQIVRRPSSGFPLIHPTWLGRRDFFTRHPYRDFDCDDQELLMRCFKTMRVGNVGEIQLAYREPSLKLRKLAHFRWENAKAVVANRASLGLLRSEHALAKIVAKSAVDVLAVKTGLGYKLLKHRAAPLSDTERADWDGVRTLLQRAPITPR